MAEHLNSITTPDGIYKYTYPEKSSLVSSIVSPDGQTTANQYGGNLVTSVVNTGPVASSVGFAYVADGSLSAINLSNSGVTSGTTINLTIQDSHEWRFLKNNSGQPPYLPKFYADKITGDFN